MATLLAILRAIPVIKDLIQFLFGEADKQRERNAQTRLQEKDAAVDDAIAAAQQRVRDRKAGEQQKADGST